jgi:hypothetical protein
MISLEFEPVSCPLPGKPPVDSCFPAIPPLLPGSCFMVESVSYDSIGNLIQKTAGDREIDYPYRETLI